MCGIAGIAGDIRIAELARMVAAMAHRGPDDHGSRWDHQAAVGLGHARLSILDLSPAGHQPMGSADGRVWVAYNGEIYNHADIRAELGQAGGFRGHSDTETLLAAYLRWGRDCLHRFNGMFAFALWDGRSGELWLVRDRFGVKPLYYSQVGRQLRFASEVRAILSDPAWPRAVDAASVDAYLRLRYVVTPRTLVEGIRSLPAGHQAIWKDGALTLSPWYRPPWQTRRIVRAEEARERFEFLLRDSVRLRLMGDVPLGIFLSGGLDSTVVTALTAEMTARPVKTFSVGFEGRDDDSRAAAEVASLLGCDHTSFTCRIKDFERLDEVATAIDQPIGDAVILPIAMLSRAARKQVTMVMTGEGADEILAGYAHQAALLKLARLAPWVAAPGVNQALRLATRLLPPGFWSRFFNYGSDLGPAGVERLRVLLGRVGSATHRYLAYASLFAEHDRRALYDGPLAPLAERAVPQGLDLSALAENPARRGLLRMEFGAWLTDNILTKQDSLTMASSVEGREPFLDVRLVEECLSWDDATFAALASGKAVLRDMLARLRPDLPRRPKNAFRLDADAAYRPILRRLTEQTLLAGGGALEGWLRKPRIEAILRDLEHSPFVRGKQLAALVILEMWLRKNMSVPS